MAYTLIDHYEWWLLRNQAGDIGISNLHDSNQL